METGQEQSDTPRPSAAAAASSTAPSSPSLDSSRLGPPRHVGETPTTTGEAAVPTREERSASERLRHPQQDPAAAATTPEDLARQLAGFTVAAQPPPTAAPRRAEPRTQGQEQQEEEWLLKEIHWPPLPPTPAAASPPPTSLGQQVLEAEFSTDPALKVKIICQNENGPCSLIALCNILILRNDLHIPSGRESVTYSYLSNLLADYFLSLPPATTHASAPPMMSLSSVLSILPQTRYGLNLNPRFDRIDGFSSSSSSSSSATTETEPDTASELALFALARIPLLHGWIADPSFGPETHQALLECGDYDAAMEAIVQGAEIAGGVEKLRMDGMVGEGEHGHEEEEEEEMLREVERRSQWTPEQEAKVRKAHLLQSFLESTSTQLTYPGLASLCQSPSLLPPAGLAALFRNSHLSVLFRRPLLPPPPPPPPLPPSSSSTAAAAAATAADPSSSSVTPTRVIYDHPAAPIGPELFTLVTDSSLVHEGDIVWESLGDVDGGGSEFFDARLGRARMRVKGGDWVGGYDNEGIGSGAGRRRRRPEEAGSRGSEAVGVGFEGDGYSGNDLALAQQLQAEEDAYTSAQLQHAEQTQPDPSSGSRSGRSRSDGAAPRPTAAGGGGVSQTLDADLRAREAEHRRLAAAAGKGKKKGNKGGGGKEDKCLVM